MLQRSSLPYFKIILLLPILAVLALPGFAQPHWIEIGSVEDVCTAYPQEMQEMLEQFDLDYPGLEKVKLARAEGNLPQACQALLDYYHNCDNAAHLRKEKPQLTTTKVAEADTILTNVFTIQNVKGQVPVGEDGHRDWYYKGPNNDREWAWLSNRHTQIHQVLTAYFETGNPKYAQYIDFFLRDFIIKSMPYPAVKSRTSVWRGLEVSFRSKVWSEIFYSLINTGYLSPATQLLMLSSLPDHAHYNRNFHGGNNWLTMEVSALATVATNFPEYRQAEEWLDYSVQAMVESMKDQVYPDGVQTELTSHYHNVSLRNFELFKEICDRAEKTLPTYYNETLENMYRYIAHAMRPDGNRVLNNDGDRGSDRAIILKGANTFGKPEWEYIATNGKSGTLPTDGPSYFHPWAGQLISRSGYDSLAHWSFFDVGPWGSGHQHNDKLHLSVAAYGHDFLVDAGRFAYTGAVAEKFRPYARSSAAHNVMLIGGQGQDAGPTHAQTQLNSTCYKITNDFDYATGSFGEFLSTEGEIKHQRAVMYVRSEFWVVVDHIKTDCPRKIEALWHWHPTCQVIQESSTVKTNHKQGNLAIVPLSKQSFSVKFIKGQEQPELQGWYSPEYNLYEPNLTTSYHGEIEGDATLVWLLLPSSDKIVVPETTILQETEQYVNLRIESSQNIWELTIPYSNSGLASVQEIQ
ncbi:MAG: alginate lyase family protein [Bacteroidota bacterium]